MEGRRINGALGATFKDPDGLKLFLERELGDNLIRMVELPGGETHRPVDPVTGDRMVTDWNWFERGVADGSLRKIADENGPLPPARTIAKLFDRDEILTRDPMAEARLTLVLELLADGIDASDPRLGRAIDRKWGEDMIARFGPKPRTAAVRSWLGRCETGEANLATMMSMSGRVLRANRLDGLVEKILDDERRQYWRNRGWKIVDVEAAVSVRIEAENLGRAASGEEPLDMPGKETIRRRVNEMLCRDTYASKYGEDAARRKFDGSGRGITASRILQVAIMDDTVIDLVTCLDADRGMIAGRPYLCVLLDLHSRCMIGMTISFVPPSMSSAASTIVDAVRFKGIAGQCIRSANQPKQLIRPDRLERFPGLGTLNGKPCKILTDNGTNYVAPAFGDMMMDLGIIHELAPVKAPRHKGIIERFFRSFNTFLIDKLPGATLDPKILRELGIDPEGEAVVTLGELQELVADFLYLYHISHHSGIDAVPLARWQSSMRVHGRDMIMDGRAIDIATGVTVHNKRVTANGGVRMFGMAWKGDNLRRRVIDPLAARQPHRERLSGTTVVTTRVKYNPEDMLHVQVFVGDDWVELENTQPNYAAGLSLWQHREILAWAKRQSLAFVSQAERLAARDALNRRIRELFPDADARERRAMSRMLGAPVAAVPVTFAEAEPRHDGLGPIIENRTTTDERQNASRPVGRPSSSDDADADRNSGSQDFEDPEKGDQSELERPQSTVTTTPVDDDETGYEEYR